MDVCVRGGCLRCLSKNRYFEQKGGGEAYLVRIDGKMMHILELSIGVDYMILLNWWFSFQRLNRSGEKVL